MAILTPEEVGELILPFYPDPPHPLLDRLSVFLDLISKWNHRTNLTAVRDPRQIVRRHFGESLFAATHLPACSTLLDLGSGAGFPGLPIALVRPTIQIVLAESQNKKAAFLMEACRVLDLRVDIWASRVELLPPDRLFDVVTLRAVDNPDLALELARCRLAKNGSIVQFVPSGAMIPTDLAIPNGLGSALRFIQNVPRGASSSTRKL